MLSPLQSGRACILLREGLPPAASPVGFRPCASEASRYLPMFRLLKDEDTAFLRGLGDHGLARRLRSRRRRVFRMFLDELAGDAVAVLRKRREEIARGAWYGLEEYCRDVGAFWYHITRLYAATVLHAVHLHAAPEWVNVSVASLLRQIAPPAAEAAS
jgi:hypothetical protein